MNKNKLYLLGSLVTAGIAGTAYGAKKISDAINQRNIHEYKKRLAAEQLNFSDVFRLIDNIEFKTILPNDNIAALNLDTYKTVIRNGITFNIYEIPYGTDIKDAPRAAAFAETAFMKNKDACNIFIHKEVIDFAEQDTLEFIINHEIGHILIPSNFGQTEFQFAEGFFGNHNLTLGLRNIRDYLEKYNLDIYKTMENLTAGSFNFGISEIDRDYMEISANLYAALNTTNADKVIASLLADVNPSIPEGNAILKAVTKFATKRVLNKLLKIAKKEAKAA